MVEVKRRGEVWVANLNPPKKGEIGKVRPVLLIQNTFLEEAGLETAVILPPHDSISSFLRSLESPYSGQGSSTEGVLRRYRTNSCNRYLPVLGRSADHSHLSGNGCGRKKPQSRSWPLVTQLPFSSLFRSSGVCPSGADVLAVFSPAFPSPQDRDRSRKKSVSER